MYNESDLDYLSNMPELIIFNVMKYLKYNDLKSLRQVSQYFNNITKYKFEKETKLTLKRDFVLNPNESSWFFNTSVRFRNFYFAGIEFLECESEYFDSFLKVLEHTKELKISYCTITKEALVEILKKLKHLEIVDISLQIALSGDRILSVLYDKVTELRLSGVDYLRKKVIQTINPSRIPTIKKLKLHHLTHDTESETFRNSGMFLFFKLISPSLKELDLFDPNEYPDFLSSWPEIGFNLENLYCLMSGTIDSDHFEKFIVSLKNITVLKLSGWQINNDCVRTICNNLRDLKEFSLQECDVLTNEGIKLISSLKKLESFDIGSCHNMSNSGIVHGIAKERNDKMRSISLNGELCDDTLIAIMKNFPNLESLVMHTTMFIQPHLMLHIFDHLTNLKTLRIGALNTIKDKDMFDLPEEEVETHLEPPPLKCQSPTIDLLQGLESLYLDGHNEDIPGFNINQISKLKNLKELYLYGNRKITKEQITQIINSCPYIEKIEIRFAQELLNENDKDEIKQLIRERNVRFQYNLIDF